jgi:hypothetical protein
VSTQILNVFGTATHFSGTIAREAETRTAHTVTPNVSAYVRRARDRFLLLIVLLAFTPLFATAQDSATQTPSTASALDNHKVMFALDESTGKLSVAKAASLCNPPIDSIVQENRGNVAKTCDAPKTAIPFDQIVREAQASTESIASGGESSSSLALNNIPVDLMPFSLSAVSVNRASPVRTPQTFSTSYFLLNGLHLGMALFDVELTQHCINNHTCREGNPLMPSSHAGRLGVSMALVGYGSFFSARQKKNHSKYWWISPTAGLASHTAGVATGLVQR